MEFFLANSALKNATYLVTQNSFQQEQIKRRYGRNGIRIAQMTPEVDQLLIEKGDNTINIVWIANLKELKRPEVFVKIAKSLNENLNCQFYVIGHCPSSYKSMIDDAEQNLRNFKYLGELSHNEVNDWLCKSHILINTSDYEGFSNTFVQAWMRKVIVLSMNSNPDNIIVNQMIGFICPSINEMKEKIESLIENREIRQEMSDLAYDYALENHSLEKNIGSIGKLIK